MSDQPYRATLDRLVARRRFGLKPGLEAIRAVLAELGNPERSFRSVHVTGSKGKGSVASMAASILTASGRRTGLFTSPHLRSFRERIRVDGEPIPPAAVVDGVARIEAASDALRSRGALERELTFFEVATALAFDHFRAKAVDAAVVEVGIGGRLDSTNVLDSAVGVLTTVELEHTEILGPTVGDIAREKAGILHRGMIGILGRLPPAALVEVERAADAVGVPLWHLGKEIDVTDRELTPRGQRFTVRTPRRTLERLSIPLFGNFQPGNAALAVAAAEAFLRASGAELPETAIRRGLSKAAWPGRLERVARRPDLWVDVAHTPESALALAQSLAEIAPFATPEENVVVFGCLADKNADGIFDALSELAQTVVVTSVRSERTARPEELRRRAVGRFRRVVVAPSVSDALPLARAATGTDGFTLVTGSDYLVGEVLELVEGTSRDEPDLSDPGRPGSEAVPSPASDGPR